MESLINVLAVAAILMTLLLAYFVVITIYRGLSGRSGLGERMPLWPGCPVAWINQNKEVILNEKHVTWTGEAFDSSWEDSIAALMPETAPEKPHAINVSSEYDLLYLPARNRGVIGWWVIRLSK